MDRRCTEEIFELSNFSICLPPLAPQISAARNSFKHDKDYYEGLLEYYQHSSFPFPCCLLGAYFTKSPHNLYTLYTACWTQSRAREPAAGDIKNVCCWCSGQAGVNTKVGIGNIVTTVSSFCLVGSLLVGCIGNRHHFENCDRSVPGQSILIKIQYSHDLFACLPSNNQQQHSCQKVF